MPHANYSPRKCGLVVLEIWSLQCALRMASQHRCHPLILSSQATVALNQQLHFSLNFWEPSSLLKKLKDPKCTIFHTTSCSLLSASAYCVCDNYSMCESCALTRAKNTAITDWLHVVDTRFQPALGAHRVNEQRLTRWTDQQRCALWCTTSSSHWLVLLDATDAHKTLNWLRHAVKPEGRRT